MSLCVQAQGKAVEGEPPPQREEVEKQSASARPDAEEPASQESKESDVWTPMAADARMAKRGETSCLSLALTHLSLCLSLCLSLFSLSLCLSLFLFILFCVCVCVCVFPT